MFTLRIGVLKVKVRFKLTASLQWTMVGVRRIC